MHCGEEVGVFLRLFISWRSFSVEIVRTSTRQFVLLFGTVLSFSNGGSLFAGMVCQPEFVKADPSDVFPKDIVARDTFRAPAHNETSEVNSSAFADGTPKERDESTTTLIESLQLLGKSFNGPLEKLSLPGAQANPLDGEDGSRPKPPPTFNVFGAAPNRCGGNHPLCRTEGPTIRLRRRGACSISEMLTTTPFSYCST
jgi:hypothetical protein